MAKKRTETLSFDAQLVLFRYFLGEIGLVWLKTLAKELNDTEHEGLDEGGNTFFYRFIRLICETKGCPISSDKLKEYDENILRHTKHIAEKRGGIKWKYFQYVALLFTEMYLDRYFSDREAFCTDLNNWLDKLHAETLGLMTFSHYTPDQLHKLAYMCATGSGKTLIMHVNILQFLHYMKRAQRTNSQIKINKIIVLSPNEGMSQQHLDELALSSIRAGLFQKDSLFNTKDGEVIIIDMNKLKEEGKVKTVSVDSFEKDNLVLVDEAHRGLTAKDIWYDYRTRLSENGFSFEYSATFKQSLHANSKKEDEKNLMEEYGKSIIMDYSYKYFYNDGYGKDYRIYNLKEGIDSEHRNLYLTGCLLTFYQQLKYFGARRYELLPFNIEKPLLVFVGNKVTASKSESELSDVQEVLSFLDQFIRNKEETIKRIDSVINENTGLINDRGVDLFQHNLDALFEVFGGKPSPRTIYEDVMRVVFNSNMASDQPRLHVVNLKQIQGEIAMKVGMDGDYFGVINVGDDSALVAKCMKVGIETDSEEIKYESLFSSINKGDSNIKILIGSRKFTEGWNSWRVSTMGLINFAKSEGSQAIQLFGRGVRLHGQNNCLKRTSAIEYTIAKPPKFIRCVETLTIFGVKSQYMEDFKALMEEEGAPTNDDVYTYTLPVLRRHEDLAGKKLCVIKVRDGVNYKKQSRRIILDSPDDKFLSYLLKSPTRIDCRSKIQSVVSHGSGWDMKLEAEPEEHPIPPNAVPALDYDRIFYELESYKNEKAYFNICIVRENLRRIMETVGWYSLIIPASQLEVNSIRRLDAATDYAVIALKSYIDKTYKFNKEKWEDKYLEFSELTASDNNYVDEYTMTYTRQGALDNTQDEIEKFVNDIKSILTKHRGLDEYKKTGLSHDSLVFFDFRSHLYAPLICLQKNSLQLQISPVSLNPDEMKFVDLLKDYTENNASKLADKSLYLLRNKSKVGMGFFEAGNFYPDFILWIDTPEKQSISFIDPKGLMMIMPDDPKVTFYKTIKDYETRLNATSKIGKPIEMNSFIMSATPGLKLKDRWKWDWEKRESHNIYTLDTHDCVTRMMGKLL